MLPPFRYGLAMVPEPTYAEWRKLCRNGEGSGTTCELLEAKMMYQQIGNVNPYALDYPVCLEPGTSTRKLSAYQARIAYTILPKHARTALGLPSDPEVTRRRKVDWLVVCLFVCSKLRSFSLALTFKLHLRLI